LELNGVYDTEFMDIIICTRAYYEILNQIVVFGVKEYYVLIEDSLYHTDGTETMMPVELYNGNYYCKNVQQKRILHIENTLCMWTFKIACLMKEQGYETSFYIL